MKNHLLLIVSLSALLLFLSVQFWFINSTWQQKEELLEMRYKNLSQEGLSLLITNQRNNGFEEAMDVTDRFAEFLITQYVSDLKSTEDSTTFGTLTMKEVHSILEDNEVLTAFLTSHFVNAGYNSDFRPLIVITAMELITPQGRIELNDAPQTESGEGIITVNNFREEHNYFSISFNYLIDLTRWNRLVLRETFASFLLIIGSVVIVFIVFAITWRNLMEERRLSELKSDFINNMTHELKTPLSTITVAGRTLQKEQVLATPSMVVETAKMIGKQSVNLNQLINTILDVGYMERQEFELDSNKVVIEELMHQVVTSYLTSCDGCAEINEDYRTGRLELSVDIVYFTTMISNLLANAVKYRNSERAPVINITTAIAGNEAEIIISDNGTGIPGEHLGHIFEKFYRVPHGNIHKTKGLGLGLYYVKRIATAHGGDITATSRPGKGTTFKIRIPIQQKI